MSWLGLFFVAASVVVACYDHVLLAAPFFALGAFILWMEDQYHDPNDSSK
jgi:hypothetical protein